MHLGGRTDEPLETRKSQKYPHKLDFAFVCRVLGAGQPKISVEKEMELAIWYESVT